MGRIAVLPTLNIKDPEVYRLAAELAERRGTTLTGAVREALERAVSTETADAEADITEMLAIARRSAARPGPFLTDDDLYDDNGIPH